MWGRKSLRYFNTYLLQRMKLVHEYAQYPLAFFKALLDLITKLINISDSRPVLVFLPYNDLYPFILFDDFTEMHLFFIESQIIKQKSYFFSPKRYSSNINLSNHFEDETYQKHGPINTGAITLLWLGRQNKKPRLLYFE